MKRWKKVLLGLLLALLLVLGGLYLWQRSNIDAALLFATSSTEDLEKRLAEQRQALQDTLERVTPIQIRPLTPEQGSALLDGSLTAAEAKQEIGATEQLDRTEKAPQPTAEDLINNCVAELYGYQADLMETLGNMKQTAVDTYLALPPDQQTDQRLHQIGLDGLLACYDLEDESDANVRALLARYRKALKAQSADTAVLDTLWTAYENKKATEKAYYMDKYLR